MTAVGIDFGTTNSVVSRWTPDGGAQALPIDHAPAAWEAFGFDRLMPSVFATANDGTALFGWAAKLAEARTFPAVKRLFATQQDFLPDDGGNVFAVEEIATMLFAELKRSAADVGVDAQQAVVTVPANSRGLARHRTKVCAGMGGIEVLALINEPTAAAMAYAAKQPAEQQLLVFDWGGGTLDVTVLSAIDGIFMEQASKGLPTKGGIDFDNRLLALIASTVPDEIRRAWTSAEKHRLKQDVELAKIKLSRMESTTIVLPGGDGRNITRSMFEGAIQDLIEEARRPIEQCLADIKAGAGAIDALVMVGGTSKIPAVRDFAAELLGRDPVPDEEVDAMTAVGEGAGIAAAILSGELETNDFFVSTEHALGVVTVNAELSDYEFSVLIPRNYQLPASATDTYFPVHPDQESVNVRVIEGDPAQPVDHPDSVVLKEWEIPLPGPHGSLDRSFDIEFEYDVDGILHVTVTNNTDGAVMMQEGISYGVTDDKRQLVKIAKQARSAVEGERVTSTVDLAESNDAEAARLLQQATVHVIPFLDDDDAEAVREAVEALSSAEGPDVSRAKQRLKEVLAPYSYLL